MTHSELVSIVTPVYNGVRFIRETIDSVLAQTHQRWEMLIVDDCSSDGTVNLVNEISRDEPRIRLLQQSRNMGPAHARNAALGAASSDLVAFLDSDDQWLPHKLERQLEFMRELGTSFTFTGFRRMDHTSQTIGVFRPVPAQLTYAGLLKDTAIATSTVMIDRSRTGRFVMPITYYDDFATWLGLLKQGHVAHGLCEDLMRYRVVGQSVSRNKWRSALWVWRTYRQIERLALPHAAWCFANYAWRGYLKYRSL